MTENKNITAQKEEPDLYKRSIKGSYWVISSQIATNILGISKSLFLAHFFFLNDLGIISAALMMMEILSTFTQTGFDSALIQKKGDIHGYLDTVWTTGIVKGIALTLILYLTAPLLVQLRMPEEKVPLAIAAFRAMSICFLIAGFRNIGVIYFSKNLDFHKTFILSLTSSLTDVALSIGLILIFRNIWGVIIARLVTAGINCIGSYVLSSYRPRFHFEPAKARELWKYGRWIFGRNILGYLMQAGDDYFVWFYLGIQQLPLYRYAYRFSLMPTTYITNVISQVSFPVYSKIQHDLPRLKDAYLKVLKITALLSIPTAFLIFLLGPDLVRLLLPERMYPMIPALQILAFKGLLSSVESTRGPLFRAIGKPQVTWHLQWIRLVVFASIIYPLTKMWGIAGTAMSTVLLNFISGPLGLLIARRLLKCRAMDILQTSFLPLLGSLVMTTCIMILKRCLFTAVSYGSVASLVVLALVIYIGIIWVIDFSGNKAYIKMVKEQYCLIKRKIA